MSPAPRVTGGLATAVLVVTAVTAPAAAAPRLPPAVPPHRAPRHLAMRRAAAAPASATSPRRAAPAPTPPPPLATPPRDDDLTVRDAHAPLSFRVDLGLAVDTVGVSGRGSYSNPSVAPPAADLPGARSYGFGDLYASSRGFLVPNLATYLATHFRLAGPLTASDPGAGAPPIASWWQKDGAELRAVWAEAKDLFTTPALAPLRLRAGRQYLDGLWATHADAVTLAWDGKLISARLASGLRVADYAPSQLDAARPRLVAASLRIDLRALRAALPLALSADALLVTSLTGAPDARHGQLTADWRPRRDVAVIGEVRALAGALAAERLQLRGRYRLVSSFVVELAHRHAADWRWDPSLVSPDEPGAPRRYLDLGPVLPRLTGSARAGTVLFDNIDLLVRGAFAVDRADAAAASTMSASWLELGGALEVRLRRTVALGVSASSRNVRHATPTAITADLPVTAQPLPANPTTGETGMLEGGLSLRMSLGARTFSALLELYGRETHFARLYGPLDPLADPYANRVFHAGGRFTVDAWLGRDLRLFAAYDLSTSLTLSPEVVGYKNLRLMVEGVF